MVEGGAMPGEMAGYDGGEGGNCTGTGIKGCGTT